MILNGFGFNFGLVRGGGQTGSNDLCKIGILYSVTEPHVTQIPTFETKEDI